MKQKNLKVKSRLKLIVRSKFESQEILARQLQINPTTLSRNLKAICESKPDAGFFERLCHEFNIDEEVMKEALYGSENRIEGFYNIKNLVKTRQTQLRHSDSLYLDHKRKIVNNLYSGDVHTSVSCESPLEFWERGLQKGMLEAIKRGAVFRYIFPTNYHISSETRGEHSGGLEKDFEKQTQWFLEKGLSKNQLDSDFLYTSTEHSTLISPFISFICISKNFLGESQEMGFYEINFGDGKSLCNYKLLAPIHRIDIQRINEKIKEVFPN